MAHYPPGCRPALRMTDERAERKASILENNQTDASF